MLKLTVERSLVESKCIFTGHYLSFNYVPCLKDTEKKPQDLKEVTVCRDSNRSLQSSKMYAETEICSGHYENRRTTEQRTMVGLVHPGGGDGGTNL